MAWYLRFLMDTARVLSFLLKSSSSRHISSRFSSVLMGSLTASSWKEPSCLTFRKPPNRMRKFSRFLSKASRAICCFSSTGISGSSICCDLKDDLIVFGQGFEDVYYLRRMFWIWDDVIVALVVTIPVSIASSCHNCLHKLHKV